MTPAEAAKLLDGSQYPKVGNRELWARMKDAGLVAVYGASDDLMEFRGAIDDELGAYEGTTAYVTRAGMLQNDCENDECPHFAKLKQAATPIDALWDDGGFSWRYDTAIPCARFIIKEDDENYCEGIVFALESVQP